MALGGAASHSHFWLTSQTRPPSALTHDANRQPGFPPASHGYPQGESAPPNGLELHFSPGAGTALGHEAGVSDDTVCSHPVAESQYMNVPGHES